MSTQLTTLGPTRVNLDDRTAARSPNEIGNFTTNYSQPNFSSNLSSTPTLVMVTNGYMQDIKNIAQYEQNATSAMAPVDQGYTVQVLPGFVCVNGYFS